MSGVGARVPMMSSDDVPATRRRTPGQAGLQSDPLLDDWLGDETTIEWFPDAGEAAETRDPGGERRGRRGRGTVASGGEAPAPEAEAAALYRRRRLILVAVILVLVAAVALPLLVLRGGGGSSPPAVPPTTPVTTPTTPASTKSSKPSKPATTTPATTTPTGQTASASRVVLPASGTMSTGDTGTEVKTLQQSLTTLGFAPGTADGIYGPLTKAAVVAFQQANGLTTDGVVGPLTAAKLNDALAANG